MKRTNPISWIRKQRIKQMEKTGQDGERLFWKIENNSRVFGKFKKTAHQGRELFIRDKKGNPCC